MDTQTLAILVLIADIVIGVVFCFFGSRWMKAIVAVYGFAAGFMLAYSLIPMFFSLSDMMVLFISIGTGVIAALLFILFFYLGIFFVGFGAGVALCQLLAEVLSLNLLDWYVYIPALILCCLLGALTLNQRHIFISVFTAFIGASALAQAVYQIVTGIKMQALVLYDSKTTMTAYSSSVYLIALAVLFVAGLVVQLSVTGRKKKS